MGYGLINSVVINGAPEGNPQPEPQSFPVEVAYAGVFGAPYLVRAVSSVRPAILGQPVLALRLPAQSLGAAQLGLPSTRLAFAAAGMQSVRFGVAGQSSKLHISSLLPTQFGLPSRLSQGRPSSFTPVRFGRPSQSLAAMVLGVNSFAPTRFGYPGMGGVSVRVRTLSRPRFSRPALRYMGA